MNRKTLYAFVVSFVLLLTVIILNRVTFREMKEYTHLVDHTREIITSFETVSNDFKSAQIYTTAYADSLKNFYTLYKSDANAIYTELSYVKRLVKDNPEQSERVDTLVKIINKHLPVLLQKNIAEIITAGEGWRLNDLFLVHKMLNDGVYAEKALLTKRTSELETFTRLNNLLSIVFSVLAVIILVLTFLSSFFLSKKRRWLEGFLESILNTSQNGVAHYKAVRQGEQIVDFKIEFLNQTVTQIFGINADEITGRHLSEFPSFIKEAGLLKHFIEVVETGRSQEFETLHKKNSAERWLLISIAKLNDGVTASFHDISQLKNYEVELKNKIDDLQRSNAELEQYAYVASHDLQEPLRKIRSFGSYLQDTQSFKLDERGRQLLDKIMSSAERMSSLIKDILSFSSMKKEGSYTSVDLNEIVKSVQQDFDLLITQKKAVVHSDVLPTIEAIPLQMTQLFYNLINNSLKFAKENEPPVINITCRSIEQGEKKLSLSKLVRYYEIIVSDNGVGFGAEHNQQIFGLFKRLNNKQFYSGSGIGLALCKKVVENHKGEIVAEGREGKGANFHIYLPEKQL